MRSTDPEQQRPSIDSELGALREFGQGGQTDAVATAPKVMQLWKRSLRFVFTSLVHILNLVLRIWSLQIYFQFQMYKSFGCLVVLELVAAIISLRVTFQDADVRWCLGTGSWPLRILLGLLAAVFLGLCQVIHVKRAWARQLRAADVLHGLPGLTKTSGAPALGGERALPVTLLTGVPGSVVGAYAYLELARWGLQDQELDLDTVILGAATVMAIFTVSVCIVEIDNSVSKYVSRRYHFDLSVQGKRVGRFQCLYPLIHGSFRTVEIVLRVVMIVLFLIFSNYIYPNGIGLAAGLGVVFLDYVVGVLILRRHSPAEEQLPLHLLVGIVLLIADVVKFVDRPGFCHPARKISRSMDWWRLTLLALMLAGAGIEQQLLGGNVQKFLKSVRWGQGVVYFSGALVLYCLLRCTKGINEAGEDLHTAVLKSRLDKAEKLLKAAKGGQVLDVNGQSKDNVMATPAMLAAEIGNIDALELLFRTGARVDSEDAKKQTVFHYAVAAGQLRAVEFLAGQEKARGVIRDDTLAQLMGLMERSPEVKKLSQTDRERMAELLNPRRLDNVERRPTLSLPVASPASSTGSNLKAVKTQLAMGKQLADLFPDAAEENVPFSELLSVSALLFSQAAGPLGRRFLPEAPSIGLLQRLRKVRTLGQGASGTVIEVEIDVDSPSTPTSNSASSLISPTSSNPSPTYLPRKRSFASYTTKRFAMKLQEKAQQDVDWQAPTEALALRRAVHPFIVKLEQAFQTPHFFILLLELCPNGDLNKLLCTTQDTSGRRTGLEVERAARYGGQVLLALVYLHQTHDIIYRDVKPENVLLSAKDEAKLADFGTALYVGRSKSGAVADHKAVGTRGFQAPEWLESGGDSDEEGAEESSSDDDEEKQENEANERPRVPVRQAPMNYPKTDAYSYGMMLQLMLLGEFGGDIMEEEDDGSVWLLPRPHGEEENRACLNESVARGRLSEEARDLLFMLTPRDPLSRKQLVDVEVRQHSFFLKALGCQDLKEFLLPQDYLAFSP